MSVVPPKFRGFTPAEVGKAVLIGNRLATLSRSNLVDLVSGEDILGLRLDRECGYPIGYIPVEAYKRYFDRMGFANRVVGVNPDESFAVRPLIYENEAKRRTHFETAYASLESRAEVNPIHHCHRADEQSGVGHFSIMVLGYNDGRTLEQSIDGLDANGNPTEAMNNREVNPDNLLYIQTFSEDLVHVADVERNSASKRWGHPTKYQVKTLDPGLTDSIAMPIENLPTQEVHWTRVVHVANKNSSSQWLATPLMEPVWNFLVGIKKVLGGAPEMFWKGAYPGYSVEMDPDMVDSGSLNLQSMEKEFDEYFRGLRRWIGFDGAKVHSLHPQMGDPTPHMVQLIQAICCTIKVPFRVFIGSEAGHLAASQDSVTWNKRMGFRQRNYNEPWIVRPLIDRLILLRVLPKPKQYICAWRDLNSLSDKDKADVALKKTQSGLQYITSGMFKLIPPFQWLTLVEGFTDEEANAIIEAAGGEEKLLANLQDLIDMQTALGATGDTNPTGKTGAGGKRNAQG